MQTKDNIEEQLSLLPERIRSKIEVQENGCWYWLGAKDKNGYGRFNFEGNTRLSHRVVRFLIRQDIPLEATFDSILDHGQYCSEPRCCNPYHTTPGTRRDNMKTGGNPTSSVVRDDVCQRGHDLTLPENIIITTKDTRRCRPCSTLRQNNYIDRNKQKRAIVRKIQNDKKVIIRRIGRGEITEEEAECQLLTLSSLS